MAMMGPSLLMLVVVLCGCQRPAQPLHNALPHCRRALGCALVCRPAPRDRYALWYGAVRRLCCQRACVTGRRVTSSAPTPQLLQFASQIVGFVWLVAPRGFACPCVIPPGSSADCRSCHGSASESVAPCRRTTDRAWASRYDNGSPAIEGTPARSDFDGRRRQYNYSGVHGCHPRDGPCFYAGSSVELAGKQHLSWAPSPAPWS